MTQVIGLSAGFFEPRLLGRMHVARGAQEPLDGREVERRPEHHDEVVGAGIEVRLRVVDLGDVDADGAE